MNEKELKELLAKAIKEGEEIRLKYDKSPKDMPGDEEERWEKAMDDADRYKRQLELLRKSKHIEEFAAKADDILNVAGKETDKKSHDGKLVKSAWLKSIGVGNPNMTSEELAALKAYQIDNPGGGGYMATPMELASEILTLMKDLCFVRAKATVFALPSAESLGVAAFDTDPADSDWTSELATGSEETTAAITRRELKPNPMAKLLKLSKTLLRKVANAESIFVDRLAYKAAITEEKGFLTGTGANKPLGLFVADSQGISTGRDITAASTSVFTSDEVINTFMNLKAQYRNRAEWIMHRDVVKAARKLKDSNNNYLWATGLGPGNGMQGMPQTLLGLPVNESEYAPNTFTTGLYMMILGDLSLYGIADALDMQIQVLEELYAATNQRGFILRKETDGMPLLEEGFSRLKLG